jgi:transposase-like protein/IS1 family transposase
MVFHSCQAKAKKFGRNRNGSQRFRCLTCRKTFSECPDEPRQPRHIPVDRALLVLHLLCEGSSIRTIERVTGTAKRTILRLLVQVGGGCERLLAELVKGVTVQDVQADEVWGYIRCKEGTKVRRGIADPEAGDAYCFIGMERHSKLVLAWHLGRRNSWDTHDFMEKLSAAKAGSFQLTTDGLNPYPDSVEHNFGARVDYAQLVKEFGSEGGEEARRYAPPRLIAADKITVYGSPEEARVRTSHIERANWTLRGHLRRMTRLSNGFSRKRANLRAAFALFFAYYNLVKIHGAIRMTPAMKADLTREPWSMADLLKAAQGTGRPPRRHLSAKTRLPAPESGSVSKRRLRMEPLDALLRIVGHSAVDGGANGLVASRSRFQETAPRALHPVRLRLSAGLAAIERKDYPPPPGRGWVGTEEPTVAVIEMVPKHTLSFKEFVSLSEQKRKTLGRVTLVPPRLGNSGFGCVVTENPVFVQLAPAKQMRPASRRRRSRARK